MAVTREKILIVDDDDNLRATLNDILSLKGFIPVEAKSGQIALEQVEKENIAVALVDLRLEDLPGVEVLRAIKERSPETECILLTGYASQETAIQAINAGAYAYLQKPFDMDQLLVILQRAVEKRAAIHALAESQALYRTFLDAIDDIAFLKDDQFRYIICNQANAAFFGRAMEEIIGREDFELMDAAAAEACRRSDRQALEQNRSVVNLETVNGRIYETHKFPVPLGNGRIGVGGYARDITERLHAEERLRLQSTALEASANAIVITDRQAVIQWANPAFSALTGYSLEEAVGKNPRDLVKSGAQGKEFYQALWDTILSGQVWRGTLVNRRKDGALYDEEMTITPLPDASGEPQYFIAIKQDVSERKRAEEALRASESRYRGLFEDSPISLWVEDFSQVKKRLDDLRRRGVEDMDAYLKAHPEVVRECASLVRLLDVNRATLSLYGVASKEDFPKDLTRLLGNEGLEHFHDELARIAAGEKTFAWEGVNFTLDGRRLDVHVTWAAVPGHEQDLSRVILSIVDLTERKRAEAAVQDRIEQLSALSRASQAVSVSLDLDTTLHEVVSLAREVSGADYASIIMVDETGWPLEAAENLSDIPALESRARKKGFTHWIVQNRQPIYVERIAGNGRVVPALPAGAPRMVNPYLVKRGIQSLVGLPLMVDERVVGVLYLHSTHPAAFEGQLSVLQAFAQQAALAVEKARLYKLSQSQLEERARAEAEVRRHLSNLEMLYRSSLAINRSLDPRQIGQHLVETLADRLSWHHVAIRLRRGESRDLELVAFNQAGMKPGEEEEIGRHFASLISSMDQGLSGLAARRGATVLADDVHAFPEYVETYPAVRSGLYVPLKIGENVVGVVAVESEALAAFSEEDAHLLETLAAHSAVAFQNARLYQDMLRASQRRDILHHASREIALNGHSLEDVYALAYQATQALMPSDNFTIALHDETKEEFVGIYLIDDGKRYPPVRASLQEGISGYVIRNGAPLLIGDANVQQAPAPVHYGSDKKSRAYLCVPLRAGDRIVGAMSAQSYQPNVYTEDDKALLEMLAGYVASAIETARLFEETHRRLRELEVLQAVSASLRQARTVDEMIPIFIRHSIQAVSASAGSIYLLDEASGDWVIQGWIDVNGQWVAAPFGMHHRSGEGVTGQVGASGTAYITADWRTDPLTRVLPDEKPLLERLCSGISLPLKAEERTVGVMHIWYAEQHTFDPLEERLLTAIADMAGNAIRRARLHEQTLLHTKQLLQINSLGRALASSLQLNDVYLIAWNHLRELVDCPNFGISLFDAAKKQIRAAFIISDGEVVDTSKIPPLVYDPEQATGGRSMAIATARPVIFEFSKNAFSLPDEQPVVLGEPTIPASAIYIPMLVKDEVIGLLELQSYHPGAYAQQDAEMLSLVANQIGLAIQNARLFEETKRRLEFVLALHTIDTAISSSLDLRLTLNVVIDQAIARLESDAAAIYLLEPHLQMLEMVAQRGFRSPKIPTPLRGGPITERIILRRESILIRDLAGSPEFDRPSLVAAEGFVTYAAYPLVAKGELKGLLEVYFRRPFDPGLEWEGFIETLAGQAAVAIDNMELFQGLQRVNLELSLAYDATIEGWSHALDLRDKETEGHTRRVTDLTVDLARRMGFSDAELVHVRRGALLHDIGKMGVPDRILLKPSSLTAEEWNLMRQHPVFAYEMLSPIDFLKPALDIPYCHHEKWDGSGYPRGLQGEQIPLAARIFAVVDVWDALTSDRPYRQAWTREQALEYIRAQAGKHFDPQVVRAFLALIEEKRM